MKKIIVLFTIVGLFYSCSSEQEKELSDENFSSKGLIGAKVAYKSKVGKVVLGVNSDELVNSFNEFSKKVKLNKKAKSYKVMEIHGRDYVRFFNEDGSVSTIALLYSSNKFKENSLMSSGLNKMYFGETVCTTEACSACCGCVPDGDYCTNCELNSRDCNRTTSG